ncbi:MAG: helix-turn-helix transcriptional regulator [Candidatus Pacebacteria bacterium]|nr:helix-turn-helix transcriptional regulator [Candidatus Paceibacterota bacterium]PIR63319.1 MAG: XRE family transcriptional regulator [Candidatus Pacebacteria bacterium CG10_big_fil_rev_8_21_14_0_10_40_26]PIZ79035.1 MAG: XRE family transcriptional regulator [Candidatus Pacebacteria bacterium CG_4_10_14_0_2_um_filter_40_20]PJA68519.1 MAG: XRE family transcriptional regulator [Candidatus Pacebacteria bacterium CG_4_9_14_3_um_filter_40_12]PJC41903.1 MAG: XRE family transcriptional regulator [Can
MGSIFQVFGENVRTRRKALGLSQEELAYQIDRDVRTIRFIESGNSNSTIKTIKKLTKALDSTASKLLGF